MEKKETRKETVMALQPPPHYPPLVGPESTRITCPFCQAHIQTNVRALSSWKTHLMALLLCCMGCWLCCCVPYCKKSCRNRNHYCPNCKNYLGTYEA